MWIKPQRQVDPPPTKDQAALEKIKPKYPGRFKGQSYGLGKRRVPKRVCYKDPETGGFRRRSVMGWSDGEETMVWDGSNWVWEADYKG